MLVYVDMEKQHSLSDSLSKPSTVEKAVQLLLALSNEHRELGTTELAKKLGLHKATVSRILIKLAQYGFVYKNNETRKYWIGPAIHQLGMTLAEVNFNQVLEAARPRVDELCELVNETVTLEIWLGNSTVVTYSAQADHPQKVIPPSALLAINAAAGVKAILAYTHEDKVDKLLQEDLQQLTENTLTDKDKIKEKLSEYLKQGFAVDDQEMHAGIRAIAAPIFNQLKQPVAAIAILMSASRTSELLDPNVISNLKAKTALVSKELAAKHYRG